MKRALTFSIFAYLIALVFAQCAVDVVEAHGKWKAACVQIECDAQAKSIREQLQIQIGAIMSQGEPEAGTSVIPMPFLPNQSAQ
jgi:hypothetical protein